MFTRNKDAMTKFMKGLEVFHGLLLCGSPGPTEVRWFTAAFKARCVVLGLMLSRLLPRSWQQTFHRQLAEAVAAAAAADRSLVCDLHTDTRRRHRQVRCLLCTRSLCYTAALSSSCILPMRFCFKFPKSREPFCNSSLTIANLSGARSPNLDFKTALFRANRFQHFSRHDLCFSRASVRTNRLGGHFTPRYCMKHESGIVKHILDMRFFM